ncbi:MAG: YceI family protein [Luteimonas sp.]
MTSSPCALPHPLPQSLAVACVLAAAALLAAFPGNAQVHEYRIDPIHTRIVFGLDHAGFSTAMGSVSGSTGWLAFDPADWSSARVDVEIPLDQLDLGNDDWNRAAKRMLDVDRYPSARFVSTSVEPVDAVHASLCGTLTLHGVSRPACLQATFNQLKRAPMPPFRRTVGFSATTTLLRADFGIDAWQSMVGNSVDLRIEVEAVRDGSTPQTEPHPEPEPAP